MNKFLVFSLLCLVIITFIFFKHSSIDNNNIGDNNIGDNNTGDNLVTNNTNLEIEDSETSHDEDVKEIFIHADYYVYSPNEIRIKKDDKIKITVISTSTDHGIEIPKLNIVIDVGESVIVTFNDLGTFQFQCKDPCGKGHDDMIGKIIVEA